MPSRREFMKGLGLTAGAAMLPGAARADLTAGWTPPKILQIFLFGAPAHSQTLWMPAGSPFGASVSAQNLAGVPGAADATFQSMGDFGSLDHELLLGDGLHPLTHLGGIHRTHLVAMRGTFAPTHTLAAAYALTGINVGNPAGTSLGARIQSAWGSNGFPKSWVLDPQNNAGLTALATATGTLPAHTRPFALPIGRPFLSRLHRTHKARTDSLLAYYREKYSRRLQHASGPVRAPAIDVYDDAMSRMASWEAIHDVLLDADHLDIEQFDRANYAENGITKGVELGVHLLHHGARHVTVLGGNNAAPDFDTHSISNNETQHAPRHNSVLWGICDALRRAPNLDIDNTLIVLHAEFGRYLDNTNGSEHWTDAYASMLFGGPVTEAGITGRLQYATPGAKSRTTEAESLTAAEFLDGLAYLAGEPADPGSTLATLPPSGGFTFPVGLNP